ncbi:MAG: glycerophosphoryl diester phosphodiesterase membrane domain-containing protein [Balneolaceae bacterium]
MKDFTLQKYRDLGGILTDSFVYIRIHYKSLGKALLLLVLPFYLISGFLVGNAYTSFFSAMMQNPDVAGDTIFSGNFMIGLILLAISSGALLTVALTHIQIAQHDEEVQLSQIIDKFGGNFFTLFILYLIIILAVSFSFFLFIIPAIYVGIKLFIAPAVAILEEKNPFEAVRRSWDLVQGHWWFTFAVYLVMNIITSFMSYVLIIPMSIFIGFVTTSGADSNEVLGTGMGIFYGLMVVIASLFSVLMLIAMCLQYYNLIERKEGRGLREQIEELGA